MAGFSLLSRNLVTEPFYGRTGSDALHDRRHPCRHCPRQLFLSVAEDKVEDFLGFQEARAFVIRLLRQPGVYRFVTYLGWQQWCLPM